MRGVELEPDLRFACARRTLADAAVAYDLVPGPQDDGELETVPRLLLLLIDERLKEGLDVARRPVGPMVVLEEQGLRLVGKHGSTVALDELAQEQPL